MYYAINQGYKDLITELSERDPVVKEFFLYLLTYMDEDNELEKNLNDIAFNIFGLKNKRKLEKCKKYLRDAVTTLVDNELIYAETDYDDNFRFVVNKSVVTYVGYPFTLLQITKTCFASAPEEKRVYELDEDSTDEFDGEIYKYEDYDDDRDFSVP